MAIKREHHVHFWYAILAIIAIFWFQDLLSSLSHTETIPYSRFQTLLEQGKVNDLVIGPDRITGIYREPAAGGPDRFSTERVDQSLAQALRSSTRPLTYSGQPPPGLLVTILGWLMPALVFFGLWMLLIRPMTMGGAGGLLSIGKSRAKIYVESDVKVTFADVAGVDEVKAELQEVIGFLRNREAYQRLGAHIPKGILLVGPPGTGKTLLARAVAGEAGVPFFSISGSEFVEMFVGVGAARVRDLFDQARARAPAIVFIDELDSLGRARGGSLIGGVHDEKEQTLNQLLAELDGFDPKSGVVLLGATNRPEVLDPALLRAGRFDRQILVDKPDRKGRCEILALYLNRIQIAAQVTADEVAALTPGFTGADLANLVNESAIVATRRRADKVEMDDFTQAVERIVAGLEKRSRVLNAREREVVAHHEMGHALVALALPGTDPIQKISIIPRGIGALGYTMQRPIEDRFLLGRTELLNRMAVLLGGRAAEALIFGDVSTGAADDLVKATEIARSMVARFGMEPSLGQVAYEPERSPMLPSPASFEWEPRHYGEDTASAIDVAVRRLTDGAFKSALAVLQPNLSLLRRGAAELQAKETCCQSNENWSALGCSRGRAHLASGHQRPPLGLDGRASSLVVVPADKVTVLIEVIVEGGVYRAERLQ